MESTKCTKNSEFPSRFIPTSGSLKLSSLGQLWSWLRNRSGRFRLVRGKTREAQHFWLAFAFRSVSWSDRTCPSFAAEHEKIFLSFDVLQKWLVCQHTSFASVVPTSSTQLWPWVPLVCPHLRFKKRALLSLLAMSACQVSSVS